MPRRDQLHLVLDLGYYLNQDVSPLSVRQFSLNARRSHLPFENIWPKPANITGQSGIIVERIIRLLSMLD